jgi:hypothetical protein
LQTATGDGRASSARVAGNFEAVVGERVDHGLDLVADSEGSDKFNFARAACTTTPTEDSGIFGVAAALSSHHRRHAAIDVQDLTVDEVRRRRGEKDQCPH